MSPVLVVYENRARYQGSRKKKSAGPYGELDSEVEVWSRR